MSEDETSHTPRSKTITFTMGERKLLLLLVNKHYEVVNNRKVDNTSAQLKNHAWEAINRDYMEHKNLVRIPRTTQQLKRCWENMKCKAKKGDPTSVKLLRWGETQYKLQKTSIILDRLSNGALLDSLNDDSYDGSSIGDGSVPEEDMNNLEDYNHESNDERDKGITNALNESLKSVNEKVLKTSNCLHCSCSRKEKTTKLELLLMEKKHSKEIHNLKVQLQKERIRREKELHKLALHELTLKVENERRRAEILERELGNI